MTTNDADWSKHPCYKQDPLPGIEPALLNSLDIRRYVDKGCLLEPESFDQKRMKPASYEMRFLGELSHWEEVDGRLEKRCRKVSEGDRIELRKNSISYLWTEERLLLPEYIAARFNLRIRDVHKGILLGTGPLIDPGFGGRILIPLHNLTDGKYFLTGGDGIIWVEFTKVSTNRYWLPGHQDTKRPCKLVAFPPGKRIASSDGYLEKAGAAAGVQSAFRGALESTRGAADEAKAAAEAARSSIARGTNFGIIGVLGVVVGVAALLFSAFEISVQVTDRVHRQSERIGVLERKLEDIEAQSMESVVAPTEEAGSASQETASEEDPEVDAAEKPVEPETSAVSEVDRSG